MRPQPSNVSPHGPSRKPPFWISPWRIGVDEDGKRYHRVTVAASRGERKARRVEITVLDESLKGLTHGQRQAALVPKIIEALQALGIVTATH